MVGYTKSHSEQSAKRHKKAKILHRTVCPLCNRAEDDPEQQTATDRAFMVSDNPYVIYSRLHGESPDQLSERVIRKLDESFARDETDPVAIPGAGGILIAHGTLHSIQAQLVCAAWLDGKSNRAIADEVGVSDKTVAGMLDHARATMLTLLHSVGIRRYQLQEAT